MLISIVKILFAYLLGSVSGSLLLGALKKVDIRGSGSGNAGGTNAFRTQGFRFALAVVIIDIGKGVIAASVLPQLQVAELHDMLSMQTLAVLCGFAAVFGHCYPIWHGFRGGKGAGTAVGVICVIQPAAVLPMLLIWLLVLSLTGWVGLATMLAAVGLIPIFMWLEASEVQMLFVIAIASFLVFTHRSNIRKMLSGSELRFEKAMIINWFR
jgi:glycerol-3-phosphate acyltransferase PlsY